MSLPISTPSTDSAPWWRRHRTLFAGILAGWISAAAVGGITAAVVIELGLFDIAALSPHSLVVGWATHTTMIHSVRINARAVHAPARFTDAEVHQGFKLYDKRCSFCHGGPGIPRERWTSGFMPSPPYLLDTAEKWSPAELRFIVGKGIKMTGMPAWRLTLSDRDLWCIVAFLEKLPTLSQHDYLAMRDSAKREETKKTSRTH